MDNEKEPVVPVPAGVLAALFGGVHVCELQDD